MPSSTASEKVDPTSATQQLFKMPREKMKQENVIGAA